MNGEGPPVGGPSRRTLARSPYNAPRYCIADRMTAVR
jgi:hypothetical protein